jgi:spore germination protein KB
MSIDGRITPRQITWLIITSSTAVVMVSVTPIALGLGRNAWLAELVAVGIMIIMAWVMVKLCSSFPKKSLVEIGEVILGKYLGKLLGLAILWFFLFTSATLLRETGEFLKANFLEETPLIVLIVSFALVVAYGVRMGLETIARVNDVFFTLIMAMFGALWVLLFKEIDLNNLFPILVESGFTGIVRGGVMTAPGFMLVVAIGMIFPYINQQERAMKMILLGLIIQVIIIVNMVIFAIGVLGPALLDVINFPGLFLSKSIRFAQFIENIDALFMLIWVLATFIKIAIFYFCLVLGTGQVFNLKGVNLLVVPTGALVVAVAMASYQSFFELLFFQLEGMVVHNWLFLFLIPAGLLTLAVIFKKKEH